jgi:hypothetical protein
MASETSPPATRVAGSRGSLLGRVFLPNQVLPRPFLLMVTAFWVALALVIWTASPWKSLPGPGEVVGAFGTLWWKQGVADAKRSDVEKASSERQAAINDLQRQIDEHRSAMEALKRDLETVRSRCAAEEGRLQGARVFFGAVGDVKSGPG